MPGHQLLVLTVLGHICQPRAGHRHHRSAVVLGFMDLSFQPQIRHSHYSPVPGISS